MPRFRLGIEAPHRRTAGKLVAQLADELRSDRAAGQPFIYEQAFSTGKLRVLVVWDAWQDVPLEERTSTILAAFEQSEGTEYREKIALASGVTMPEAHAAGMLPYRVFPALRKGDPVTPEQCQQAMLAEGATTLLGPDVVQLWFATQEEADASVKRMAESLPGSADVWVVSREIVASDFADAEDAASAGPG